MCRKRSVKRAVRLRPILFELVGCRWVEYKELELVANVTTDADVVQRAIDEEPRA